MCTAPMYLMKPMQLTEQGLQSSRCWEMWVEQGLEKLENAHGKLKNREGACNEMRYLFFGTVTVAHPQYEYVYALHCLYLTH